MTDAGAGATAPLVCAISRRRRVPRAVAFVSLLSLLLWWLDRGEKESPQEMDAMFHQLVWTGLRS